MKRKMLQAVPMVILLIICLVTANAWVFARFVHYHAQRQILSPPDYTVDVIPATNGEADSRDMTDFRKSEDGRYYVRVATLGTADCMARITSDLLPPFVLAVIGFVASVLLRRKYTVEPNQQGQMA